MYNFNQDNIYGDPSENLDEIIQNPYYGDGTEHDNQLVKVIQNPYYEGKF